jgi:hypothetical protein
MPREMCRGTPMEPAVALGFRDGDGSGKPAAALGFHCAQDNSVGSGVELLDADD